MDTYVNSYDFYRESENIFDLFNHLDRNILIFLIGFFIIIGVIILIACILTVIGEWKAFKKAGEKPWKALIPIYNTYTLCELTGVSPWWIVITICASFLTQVFFGFYMLTSIVTIYFSVILSLSVARSFSKDETFGIGLIIFPPIFYMILGCGNSKYIGPTPTKDFVFDAISNKKETVTAVKEEAKESEKRPNYCPECGKKINKKEKYCQNCGKKI